MKVLFICVENSCRSQMAEGFARLEGGDQIEAWSSGSAPSGVVNPKAVESMARAGIDLSTHRSKGVDTLPPLEWDYAITMGCGDRCPSVEAINRDDWPVPDPKQRSPDEFDKIRDEIHSRVKDLLGIDR